MATPPTILVLNGPNLNMLGTREPETYGAETLDDIVADLETRADELGVSLEADQSNHEGELIDALQRAHRECFGAVILNAGGFTHTSVALRDAVAAIDVPVIELHISNPAAREDFRKESLIAPVAKAGIFGFGTAGYRMALDAAASIALNRASD
ncbi:type II 3-dehydroquinate dehydratase [Sphingomicrobium clamense]|uniref:3-dehydroquinate dehydratase n=1 Tax=Sphingomicrobium clamense TaxID=2851013 RepID=A0ABS6V4T9_9SPHN|nr:type II 3-dehydroquinate dehydratase [Sphingomicrobium sp. B8]MBW0144570.1 type II 3-dehydroquinate dehydratase [Sphingomicrobium sp. B8]